MGRSAPQPTWWHRCRLRVLGLTWCVATLTCARESSFLCSDDAQCQNQDASGLCEANGYCSFEDDTCSSGRRYKTYGGTTLSGVCVDEPPADSGSDSIGSGTDTAAGSSTSGTPGSSSNDATSTSTSQGGDASQTIGDTTSSTTSGVTSASTQAGTTSSSGTTSGTGSPGGLPFQDDFNRPDAADPGDPWLEHNPDAFAIDQERLVPTTAVSGYAANLIEVQTFELLDVEASVELSISNPSNFEFPQIHARVDTSEDLRSYICYVRDSGQIVVSRQEGLSFDGQVFLVEMALEAPIDASGTYLLSMRVFGVDPVTVECSFERIDEELVLGNIVYDDVDAARIVTEGTVALSVDNDVPNFVYDNFYLDAL